MLALLEEFKKEHSKIIKILNEAKKLGILTKEGQAKAIYAKATLLEHLDEEDEKIYPVLWNEAKQNKKLNELLEVFGENFESICRFVLVFFDRFDKNDLDESFFNYFGTLIQVLRNRMDKEENILYGEYEKIYHQTPSQNPQPLLYSASA